MLVVGCIVNYKAKEVNMKAKKCQIALAVMVILVLAVPLIGCAAGGGKVAVIPLSGVIAGSSQQGLLTQGGISPKLVRDYLTRAESDGGVKAVVLRIDSPGGSLRLPKRLRQRYGASGRRRVSQWSYLWEILLPLAVTISQHMRTKL